MLEDFYVSGKRGLFLRAACRKARPKRVFRAALDAGEQPGSTATVKLIESYFRGSKPGERNKLELCALVSLVLFCLALYVVWPEFVKSLEIGKVEDKVYDIAPAGLKSDRPAPRSAQSTTRLKTRKVPALFPKINDVTLTIERPAELSLSENFSGLSINGSVGDLDLGTGDGLSGPVLRAGGGGVIPEPELLYRVEPDYPAPARRERVDGFVLIEAIVNQEGDVINVKTLQSPPRRYGFAEKATEAVSKWKFRPSVYNGKPVSVRITFAVEFNLIY
jgi:TonB family protein